MESIAWMAWTLPTAIFFALLATTLAAMTWLAFAYPEAECVGVLRIPTTQRGAPPLPWGEGWDEGDSPHIRTRG